MGFSHKSHSKKSDKETQSPVLKIFRDMVQKEKNDPEKTNLLRSKNEKKRKKQNSKSKSSKSVASSCCSEQLNTYRGSQILNAEFDPIRTRSTQFQGEKRESWWCWGDTAEKPVSDETCSCVSCALERLISTDYVCMACLVLLFSVSLLVAFLLVYKSIPSVTEKLGSKKTEDRPKRKIDGLSKIRWDQLEENRGNYWNNGKYSFGLPASMDVQNTHDLASLVDPNSELSNILDGDLMNEIQGSDKLKEFYKQLIKTDAEIQNLKKNNDMNINNDNLDNYRIKLERAKRSLKIFRKPLKLFHFKQNKSINNKLVNKNDKIKKDSKNTEKKLIATTKETNQKNIKTSRNKRYENTSEPEGFVFEDKKILIHYKPRKSKCSHAPKDSKSHEKQLKHPFYQNTQRLDELLDKFMYKNLPDILDPLDLGIILEKEKCKHPKVKKPDENIINTDKTNKDKTIANVNDEIKGEDLKKDKFTRLIKSESNMLTEQYGDNEVLTEKFGENVKRDTTTNAYGLLMSVSTMMYPDNNDNMKRTTYLPLIDRVPNARKLLQTDADDDLNEVIVEAHDNSVDANDGDDRNKRTDNSNKEVPNDKLDNNPASIVNPNWKGPMPLYPDELNSMVKQEPRINRVENPVHFDNTELLRNSGRHANINQNLNRVDTPSKDTLSETDEFEADLNDMDYIEDYFQNKYDKLVEMAQAYSDYGVLEGNQKTDKKMDEKIKIEGPDRTAKLSLNVFKNGLKNSIFGRSKKGNQNTQSKIPSEGFRLEFQPTSAARVDSVDLLKNLQKHLKLTNNKPNSYEMPTTVNTAPDLDLMYTPKLYEAKTTKKSENGIIFSIGKGKRTLKSVDTDEESEEIEVTPTKDQDEKIYEIYNDMADVEENGRNVHKNAHLRYKRVDNVSIKERVDNVTITKGELTSDVPEIEERSKILHNFVKNIEINDTVNMFDNNARQKREVNKNSTLTDKLLLSDHIVKNKDVDVNTKIMTLTEDKTSNKINETGLSDFFMMLSNFFSVLDGVDVNFNQSDFKNVSPLRPLFIGCHDYTKFAINLLDDISFDFSHQNNNITGTKDSGISYPMYDSDMIENIGHRSRVLLSIDVNVTKGQDKDIDNTHTDKTANITDISKTNINKTKTIVKRNADESNLIFWNDLYDDEYGVVDNAENVREKYSIKNDFIKKPNDWFRDKVKKITDGIHRKAESFKNNHKDLIKEKDKMVEDKLKHNKAISSRVSRNADDSRVQTDFAALTANMKKVCRKAAKDVTLAKKADVSVKDGANGQATSSLMQQLVRLMGDLVDYQVQQRTCRKLPEDLQNFLEWLTSPDEGSEAKRYNGYKTDDFSDVDFYKMNDKEHTLDMAPSERQEKPNSRSDCLGTLQSVRALMKEYDNLPDDDKSKMTGVKDYLENQIQYLQKQIASNDINLYNPELLRYKRDISQTTKDEKLKKRKSFKQIFSKLIKKLGRKNHNSVHDNIVNNNITNNNEDARNNNKNFDKMGSTTFKQTKENH